MTQVEIVAEVLAISQEQEALLARAHKLFIAVEEHDAFSGNDAVSCLAVVGGLVVVRAAIAHDWPSVRKGARMLVDQDKEVDMGDHGRWGTR